jgi:hypothetical protein
LFRSGNQLLNVNIKMAFLKGLHLKDDNQLWAMLSKLRSEPQLLARKIQKFPKKKLLKFMKIWTSENKSIYMKFL